MAKAALTLEAAEAMPGRPREQSKKAPGV